MAPSEYVALISCRQFIFDALRSKMCERAANDDWIANERMAVAVAANQWAESHGFDQRVTVDDVERIEVTAVGHVDYASKLSLYIAEFVVIPHVSAEPGRDV